MQTPLPIFFSDIVLAVSLTTPREGSCALARPEHRIAALTITIGFILELLVGIRSTKSSNSTRPLALK